MRRLPRADLPERVLLALAQFQAALDGALAKGVAETERATVVEGVWDSKRRTVALEAAELALRAMASGDERCMYCEDGHGSEIDHLRPKSRSPEKAFSWLNLLWACGECNRTKLERYEETMVDPTAEDPFEHLFFDPNLGRYVARPDNPRGAATLRVLRRLAMAPELERGRRRAWVKLGELLRAYDEALSAADTGRAEVLREVVVREPFSAVFAAMTSIAHAPGAATLLDAELRSLLRRRPEVFTWLADADQARIEAAKPELEACAKRLRLKKLKNPP